MSATFSQPTLTSLFLATVIIFITFWGLFSSQRREINMILLMTTLPHIFKAILGWDELPSVLTSIFH